MGQMESQFSSAEPHARAVPLPQMDLASALGPALAQAALAHAPTIIYVYDVKEEKSLFQNRRFAELLGHASDDGNDWRRFMHADDAMGFPEYRRRLKSIKPEEVLTWTYRMRHASGEWHHFVSRDVLLEADADGTPRLIVGNASNVSEQKAAEERKNLLLGEMRHRARNLVTIIDAIGRQSMPRENPSVVQFFDAFMGRMRALLDTADTVLSSERRLADLRSVADTALAPFVSEVSPRIHIDGPAVLMEEHPAANLALALHELATNATKYGALSVPQGSVSLSWSLHKNGEKPGVTLEWREQDGPPVTTPSRQGFGTRVIKNALRGSDSEIDLNFAPQGLHCRISFSLPGQP
jgi:PAS domain S-box-containing protein